MDRTHLLAALAGAVVTVTVQAGTARIGEATLHAGERATLGPADRIGAPDRVGPRGVAANPTTADASARAAQDPEAERSQLRAENERLRQQLAAARLSATFAEGAVAHHEGVPQPWPDDLPEIYRPAAFQNAVAAALAETNPGELVSIDYQEFPCFALLRGRPGEDWQGPMKAFSSALKPQAGDDAGVGQHMSVLGTPDGEQRFAGIILQPGGVDDPELARRTNYRVESAIEEQVEPTE